MLAILAAAVVCQDHHAIQALDQVVVANRSFVAHLPDGGTVKLLEVDRQGENGLEVVWPQSKRASGAAKGLDSIQVKEGVRGLWLVYQVPIGGEMPMRRWIHDPDVEFAPEKVSLGEGVFGQAAYFPEDTKHANLRLGVPFGIAKSYRTWKLSPDKAKDAAWLGVARDPNRILISVDLPLDPGASEFIGFLKTKNGKMHLGEVASWVMDDNGRLMKALPQDFKFPKQSAADIAGFTLKIRSLAYVEFRDVPLTP